MRLRKSIDSGGRRAKGLIPLEVSGSFDGVKKKPPVLRPVTSRKQKIAPSTVFG